MKKITVILGMLMMICGLTTTWKTTSYAAERLIRIGYIDYDGFIEQDNDGNYMGYGITYLNEISKHTGWKYEFVYDTWENQFERLKSGDIDFVCHAQKTAEREEDFVFSKYSVGAEQSVLYVTKDNEDCFYNDYEHFNGMKIGFLKNSFQNDMFSAYATDKGFTYTPYYFGTDEEAFDAMDDGEIDAVAMGSLANRTDEKVVCKFGSDPFYFMTAKGNDAILSTLNDALEEIQGENPYFQQNLYKQFYGQSAAVTECVFTREEIDYIKNAGKIKVGLIRNRYPISCYDEDTKQSSGITKDLLEQISEVSGLEFEYEPIELNVKPLDALKDGKTDLVAGVLKTNNFLNDNDVVLSDTYFESTIAIVKKREKKYKLDENCTIALKKAFQAMEEYITSNYPQCKTKYYSTDEEALKALEEGTIDYYFQNVHVMNYMLQKPQFEDLELVTSSFIKEENVIAGLKVTTDQRLLSILNKAIRTITETEKNDIVVANTSAKLYVYTLSDILYKYRMQLFVIIIALALLFIMFIVLLQVRKRSYILVEKKNKQLMDAIEQTQRANEVKGEFLAQMSHEIRTPMNAIIGVTAIAKGQLREQKILNGELQDNFDKIETASKSLLEIINNMLNMSELEDHNLMLDKKAFDLKELLNDITRMYYGKCKEKGIDFKLYLEKVTEEILVGDPLRFNQILNNLISNAIKFTNEDGTITIIVKEEIIQEDTVYLRVEIKDTGIGMDQEVQERIFKPFEQENKITALEYGGSGLGLAITKNIVSLMEGNISVTSSKDEGSTFLVELPFGIARDEEAISASSKLRTVSALVVNDDNEEREYISEVLNRIGIKHDIVDVKDDVVEILKEEYNKGNGYDICFLDWKENSFDIECRIREIRAEFDSDTLSIVVSAYDLAGIEKLAKDAGVNLCVTKPIFQSAIFNLLMDLTDGGYNTYQTNFEDYHFENKRILLAEDNNLNAEIAMKLLKMTGLEVEVVKNGQEAVEQFMNSEEGYYNLILMDIQMPVLNGYDATRTIRKLFHKDAKTIPIIAMTANAFAEDVASALAAGMNNHIAKPIDTHIFFSTLQKYLEL